MSVDNHNYNKRTVEMTDARKQSARETAVLAASRLMSGDSTGFHGNSSQQRTKTLLMSANDILKFIETGRIN